MTSDGKTINQDNPGSKYNNPDYIRVSEFLQFIPKGERMTHWYYKFRNYKEMREALRLSNVRGSWVDNFVKNRLLKNSDEPVPPEYQGYVDAFDKFYTDWRIDLIVADKEVSDDEHKYVGTLDIYGAVSNSKLGISKLGLIDVKTGEPGKNRETGEPVYEVFPSMHCQTASYAHAFRKSGNVVEKTYILRLFLDGNYLLEPDNDEKKSFDIAMAALALRRLTGPIK